MGTADPQGISRLRSGENLAIETVETVASIICRGGAVSVDGQALLVDTSRRVRSDADFVFYNAPKHPSRAVEVQPGSAAGCEVRVNLSEVELAIDKVVLTVSSHGAIGNAGSEFRAVISQRGQAVAEFTAPWPDRITALMVGEFYRRGSDWKFRAIGQGWDTGLAGLATEFGVAVEAGPAPMEPSPRTASATPSRTPPRIDPNQLPRQSAKPSDWYQDPHTPGQLRWWDSTAWTTNIRHIHADPTQCDRCGQPLRTRRFSSAPTPCRACENQISQYMNQWRSDAWQVLTTHGGPNGHGWDRLWEALRFERIPASIGLETAAALGMAHLEQIVTFAFADGEIEADELLKFDRTVRELQLPPSTQLSELQQRMQRGRSMTQIRAGDLPRISPPGIHLDPDEIVYLDVAVNRIRLLASGAKYDPGRLIVSNKKIRYVGTTGTELNWSRVVAIRPEYRNVVISATTARGGATFSVHDPEYVSAVLEGALRVAKRLVLAPGQRDSRAIPQHIKSEVWQRDGGHCTQCGDNHYLEYDHVIPHSMGGATSLANLQLLCRRCNLAKGARL
ncbi:TerD family protein [Gordonia rubripertincta]|uniref:TerD family protein n=1 Tax=Gordonia rubripertincta TaxID=36822 RepID=A0ABT4MWU4_GORRU|nr:TerD family protein [Gordonia rubripertincta]MCZ4551483.1 TerD family protein [Gordonia rubripertincta]